MPVLKYFLTAGTALTMGLLVLSDYLRPAAPAKVSKTATSASILNVEPHRGSTK